MLKLERKCFHFCSTRTCNLNIILAVLIFLCSLHHVVAFSKPCNTIGLPFAIGSTKLEMIKRSEREYLNSLKGSKSKTFVLKKGSNELREVMAPSARQGKSLELANLFNFSFKKQNVTPIGTINTMERKILNDKAKQQYFFKNAMASSSEEPPTSQVVAPSKLAGVETVVPSGGSAVDDKFSFSQRIESVKTAIVGLLSGGVTVTPITFLHDYFFPGGTIPNGLAQWEFDTDTGSIAAALFAIVYRYCVREGEETNPMLPMGVVGAFVIVRTLSRVRVSYYCEAAPLDCGAPFGYFDWAMLQQALFSGLESIFLFGAAAAAMEYCYKKGYITRFK